MHNYRKHISIDIEFAPGTDISDACYEAVEFAEELQVGVRFSFNGCPLYARGSTSSKGLVDEYNEWRAEQSRACTPLPSPTAYVVYRNDRAERIVQGTLRQAQETLEKLRNWDRSRFLLTEAEYNSKFFWRTVKVPLDILD